MKKFVPIIIGVLIGIAMSMGLSASGEENAENDNLTGYEKYKSAIQGFGQDNQWKSVFSSAEGFENMNFYYMVKYKAEDAAHDKTIDTLSQSYGRSRNDMKAMVNGSIAVILHDPERKSGKSQEEAYEMLLAIQDEYADLLEIYQIQEDVEMTVGPKELFSNGDLSDSGFDLLYDLELIEKVLFFDITESSAGEAFEFPDFDSPVKEPNYKDNLENDNENEEENEEEKTSRDPLEENYFDEDKEGEEAGILIGDELAKYEILEDDLCPTDNPWNDADDDFGENGGENGGDGDNDAAGALRGDGGRGGDGFGADDEDSDAEDKYVYKEIEAAPADNWKKSFCNGFGGNTNDGAAASSGSSNQEEIKSLSALRNAPDLTSAGASSGAGIAGMSANVSICVTVDLVWKTVSSYDPGESCVQCEVEKMLETMKKVLNHSLVSNKTTGNLFEAAKCKNSYDLALALNLILVPAPIATPPHDDLTDKKNVFDEWNSFVDKIGWDLPEAEQARESVIESVLGNNTQGELFDTIESTQEAQTEKREFKILSEDIANTNSDLSIFEQAIIPEIKQMRLFFEIYQQRFAEEFSHECKNILKKPQQDGE